MPDIACQPNQGPQATLDWVGMSGIEMPILIQSQQQPMKFSAKVQAYVNLIDPNSKGIHMSRLYLLLNEKVAEEALTPAKVQQILEKFIETHQGMSDQAFVEFRFDFYESRKSLKSDNSGWKYYPVILRGEINNGKFHCELGLQIPYSSTCPCSAALSRQIIQESFEKQFAGKDIDYAQVLDWLGTPEGICATPHSQRSYAQVKLNISNLAEADFSAWIAIIEDALQTPVQATVKREDEQEFARLNAANLMFCEDASRRLKDALNAQPDLVDFWLRVNHLESLHPHDAIAVATKGVAGGYINDPNLMGLIQEIGI